MTTTIEFLPTPSTPPFAFSATLDGQQYAVLASWNLFGQRWYVNVYAQDGTRVLTRPMTPSPTAQALATLPTPEVVETMVWSGGQVAFVMATPTVYNLGDRFVVSGATNTGTGGASAVNGEYVINTWADAQHFTALLTAAPGVVGIIGGAPVIPVPNPGLRWSDATGASTVTAQTAAPHGYPLGQQVRLVIAGASPDGYNGTFTCAVTAPDGFTYPLATDPGPQTALVPPTYSPDINLVGGYFASSLVWRAAMNRFEVSP